MNYGPNIHTWDSTINKNILEDMSADLCLETCGQGYFGNEKSLGRRKSFLKMFLRINKRLIKNLDINHINKQIKIKDKLRIRRVIKIFVVKIDWSDLEKIHKYFEIFRG